MARRLPDIEHGGALEGQYLGMFAFGLEEMGDYARAETAGRMALQHDARNAWAIHALQYALRRFKRKLATNLASPAALAPDPNRSCWFSAAKRRKPLT